jgi:hypothetical protein
MVNSINAISKRTATHVPARNMGFLCLTIGADSVTVDFALPAAVRRGLAFVVLVVLVGVLRAIF